MPAPWPQMPEQIDPSETGEPFDEAGYPTVPSPTPFVPDVATFLKLIGRGLSAHASKFPSWEALFTLSSEQLKELGIEPPRTRRYLLQWRQRFRQGIFGIGGEIQYVEPDGTAELRVLEVPSRKKKFAEVTVHSTMEVKRRDDAKKKKKAAPAAKQQQEEEEEEDEDEETDGDLAGRSGDTIRIHRFVVNVPIGAVTPDRSPTVTLEDFKSGRVPMARIQGYRVRGAKTIYGPYAIPLKEFAGARITICEGMWEHRRGHKVDGGERRRTEIRYKKAVAERREMRERGLL
ncbi:telomere length regulation protein [Diatrype stigma]|uniref:Small ribosomal subunit protein mS41 n=1 Tax=Diatrype stigma TaxID=117547 RepID=A0AAN9YWT1_9PEZI